MAKICIARVDRIGDLVLSLPCEELWLRHRPHDQVEWLVHENLKFVIENASPKKAAEYLGPVAGQSTFAQLKAAVALTRRLKEKNFDEVIAIYVPWWVALAFWLAKVRRRTGVASQWFSFLFFNRRLRQKRSQALKHESEYNFDLIAFALGLEIAPPLTAEPATLKAPAPAVEKMKVVLKALGANFDRLVVIHAGMAGSARNWPPHFYRDLAMQLLARNLSVVITGSTIDKPFIEKTTLQSLTGVVDMVEKTKDAADMLALLSLAKSVVAPSTGVAHLAASLKVHVVGIYSPVRVQAPRRWAPRGPNVHVEVPRVDCPGILNCLGRACPHFDCMEQIPVESIVACVMNARV